MQSLPSKWTTSKGRRVLQGCFNLEQLDSEGDAFLNLASTSFAIFEVKKLSPAGMRHFPSWCDEHQLAEVRKKITAFTFRTQFAVPLRFSRSVGQPHSGCRS
jgi:hypothetical protein